MPVNTRSSVTEDELLIAELNEAYADVTKFSDLSTVIKLLRYQINQNATLTAKVEKNSDGIAVLQEENRSLRTKVQTLEEDTVRLDQYSRKDVLIVTGLGMDENETRADLVELITGMFNKICTNRTLTSFDFCAIHRNGTEYKNNRPPSATVKFLRFTDKDLFFTRTARLARVQSYRTLNFSTTCVKLLSRNRTK